MSSDHTFDINLERIHKEYWAKAEAERESTYRNGPLPVNPNAIALINHFLGLLAESGSIENALLISQTFFPVEFLNPSADLTLVHRQGDEGVNLFNNLQTVAKTIGEQTRDSTKRWDLIFGDFPMGVKIKSAEGKSVEGAALKIIETTELLTPDGLGVFIVTQKTAEQFVYKEPPYEGKTRADIAEWSQEFPYHLKAVFMLPEGFSQLTKVPSALLLVGKGSIATRPEKFFLASISDGYSLERSVQNFTLDRDGFSIPAGTKVKTSEFIGLPYSQIKSDLDKMIEKSDYASFQNLEMDAAIASINLPKKTGEPFSDHENSIYIPRIGASDVVNNPRDLKIKAQNYYQIVLSKEIVDSKYATAFLNSKVGKIAREALKTGAISHLPRNRLHMIPLLLPTLETQTVIASSYAELRSIRSKLNVLEDEFALRPLTSRKSLDELRATAESFGSISAELKVLSAIEAGETKTTEFKQTFSWDIKEKKKAEYLIHSCLKTVVAFLNTDGGILAIGVNDDGEVTGLDEEIGKLFKNNDKFLNNFKDHIKRRIGVEFFPYIDYQLVEINEKTVLYLEASPSFPETAYLDDEIFIRTSPATEKLTGKALEAWFRSRQEPQN